MLVEPNPEKLALAKNNQDPYIDEYGEGEQKACYVQAAMTLHRTMKMAWPSWPSTNTFVVDSKKRRAETTVIYIRPKDKILGFHTTFSY